ncbi:hypothetical protein D9613_006369 [Agrocybe pediades]|uniref:NACHT domain-containing protein n=1 Tax=Agrocybe pediades TaxID=84607 RepID=A0A8H4QUN9_9AGAR|nr:hypothetical protein D9613_006369 [Agrocybe pediades]
MPRTYMISSKQVIVSGGQFIQQHYHGPASVGSKAPMDILTETVATNALHDSGASFDKPKCHPRTRVKILEDIMHWILGKDSDTRAGKQFMWLNGAAGCGKSAIAQSTIESCIKRSLPLASFIFSRSDSTRNHAGPLVATLAYQLYYAFPQTEVQTGILSAIREDPLIFKKTLQQQFTALILKPLTNHFSKTPSNQQPVPFLIIIDGLDECIDRNAQKAILTGLAESVHISNLSIPIFVASRPEHDIKLSFGSENLKDMHTALSLDLRDDAESDIRLYLFDRFAEIKDDFDSRTTGRKLAHDWPGDEVIETLVRRASHQFIYVATVIRYVESTRHRPDHRLDVVLNLRPDNGDHPFRELDALYAMILESVLDVEKVLCVLSLDLMDIFPICCSIMEKLLSYDEGEVSERLFCDMGALVQVDNRKDYLYLTFLHTSFREYLLDAVRSKQFYIDKDQARSKFVTHVLRYLALCCSSSFNLIPDVAIPIDRFQYIQVRMSQGIYNLIPFPLELQQAALSFPLKEFLELQTTSHTYLQLLAAFVIPFLTLLEEIAFSDPTLSYIRDHQLDNLRSILLPQIQQYFNNDRLALILVLFYHLGSHRCIPILEYTQGRHSTPIHPCYYSNPFHLVANDSLPEGDLLSLSRIWLSSSRRKSPGSHNPHHLFVRQLLCDPGQNTKHALEPIVYERAALACFKELAGMVLLSSISGKNINPVADHAEDDIHPELNFYAINGDHWRFGYTRDANEDLYFLLLGYVIFLLPRCGRSEALVAACKDHIRPLNDPFRSDDPFPPEEFFLQYNRFPVRRRLFHEAITSYLARVLLSVL